jgi:hypothetical protein
MKNLFPYNYRTNIETCQLNNSIWFFGCSHVYGHELLEHQTAPAILEKIIGVPVINLGISGGNIFNIQHNLTTLLKLYQPSGIVISWPRPTRWMDSNKFNWGPWMLSPNFDSSALDQQKLNEYKKLIETDSITQLTNEAIFNIQKIIKYWPSIEFTYTAPQLMPPTKTYEIRITDFTNDKRHPGPETNFNTAIWIAKQLRFIGVGK